MSLASRGFALLHKGIQTKLLCIAENKERFLPLVHEFTHSLALNLCNFYQILHGLNRLAVTKLFHQSFQAWKGFHFLFIIISRSVHKFIVHCLITSVNNKYNEFSQ